MTTPAIPETTAPDGHETEKQLEFWASEDDRDLLDQAMWRVWLHGQWRFLTGQMAVPVREAAADAVIRFDNGFKDNPEDRLDARALRWWRS